MASKKVLEEMVRLIDDPKSDHDNRGKALQLIRAWGESEDLMYLPVFHQTYMVLLFLFLFLVWKDLFCLKLVQFMILKLLYTL